MLANSLLCVWSLFPATHACECVHSSHIRAFVPLATQMSSEDEESEEEELDPEAEKKAVMEKLEAEFEEMFKRWLVHRLNFDWKARFPQLKEIESVEVLRDLMFLDASEIGGLYKELDGMTFVHKSGPKKGQIESMFGYCLRWRLTQRSRLGAWLLRAFASACFRRVTGW